MWHYRSEGGDKAVAALGPVGVAAALEDSGKSRIAKKVVTSDTVYIEHFHDMFYKFLVLTSRLVFSLTNQTCVVEIVIGRV